MNSLVLGLMVAIALGEPLPMTARPDPKATLLELQELRDQGVLSEAEFKKARKRVLDVDGPGEDDPAPTPKPSPGSKTTKRSKKTKKPASSKPVSVQSEPVDFPVDDNPVGSEADLAMYSLKRPVGPESIYKPAPTAASLKSYQMLDDAMKLYNAGRYEECIDLALKAAEIDPDVQAHLILGVARVQLRQWQGALVHLEIAYKIQPVAICLINISKCHMALGQREELLEDRRRMLEFPPRDGREKYLLQMHAQMIKQTVDATDAELKRRGLKYVPRNR